MHKYLWLLLFFLIPLNVWAAETAPVIKFYDLNTLKEVKTFYPFSQEDKVIGLSFDVADLNNDGQDEIIIGQGKGQLPKVKIYSLDGALINEFLVYHEKSLMGVKVTTADWDNDGQIEIIATPNAGGGPQIRIFNLQGFVESSFFAFDENLRGGADVAIGDVNKDGLNEIIAGNGETLPAKIKIFTNKGVVLTEFISYANYRYGQNIEILDINNDGFGDIITAPQIGYGPLVRIFDQYGQKLKEFFAFGTNFTGGVNFDLADVNNDKNTEFISGAGFSGDAQIRFLSLNGNESGKPAFYALSEFRGGIMPKIIKNKDQKWLAVATQYIPQSDFTSNYKMIEVDLTKQRLFSYYKSQLVAEYKTSTGTWKYPTPVGTYKIRSKIPSGTMSWTYGPDHPDNYNLKNVPYILPFYGSYTIHGAYWHNNFGYRMSHGCVNLSVPDSKKMYDWSDVGLPVHIYASKK